MAPVAAVQELGLLVVPRGQVELLGQGSERGDLPLGHASASAGGWCPGCKRRGGESGHGELPCTVPGL